MKTFKTERNPRKKPLPISLGKTEREKAEAIANTLEVSLAEAIRRAILAYPLN
jgi:hypothetical protein